MKMQIRRAESRDSEKIKDLLNQVLNVHHNGRPDVFKPGCRKYTDEELTVLMADEKKPIFVYEDEDGVQGYAFCIIKITKGDNILCDMKTLYIDDLCVDECARGKHVGTALYDYVKSYAKDIGCYNLTLNVWECNPGAKKFYEKMGLIPQKTIMETVL
jgi:ribosomal protein S18 acetylase RimI-like enzyme